MFFAVVKSIGNPESEDVKEKLNSR